MSSLRRRQALLMMLAASGVAACAAPPEEGVAVTSSMTGPPDEAAQIERLSREIRALGPEVAPEEAARAARIAYAHTRVLAIQYEIEDPPLIHNTKVNMGLKPRGLCWHWAEDMETRLAEESFETLDLHRAIANADSFIRIEHSTVIVSRRGDDMFDGIVLDPWRFGGTLFWGHTDEDPRYVWEPQQEVFRRKLRRRGLIDEAGEPIVLNS